MTSSKQRCALTAAAITILMTSIPVFAQSPGLTPGETATTTDLDVYYQYPLAVGVRYDSLSPFADYGSTYNVFTIGGSVTMPWPSFPTLQPMAEIGLTQFDSQDVDEPERWDHAHFFLSAGAGYVRRLSKSFEVGGTALLGLSMARFPNVIEEPVAYLNFFTSLGGTIGLSPSYNLRIAVEPRIYYQRALSQLRDFNGLSFGVGFSASYRLGDDPDAPQNAINAIRFANVELPDLFAAMQSYYAENAMGTVVIENTARNPIANVTVSFFQNGLMDSPTISATIPELEPGASREVDLLALFNSEVFELEGITPLTGEVIVQYESRQRPAEQRQSVSYDLYDKTALTWDDDRKVGAFITPADGALRNYQAALNRYVRDDTVEGMSDALESAMATYAGLVELGLVYQVDPTSPFTRVQENTVIIDSVSLPRDTLRRYAGDCDDLTVLFCSMMEAAGVATGFITVPGHIYPVINTKIPASQFRYLHPDRSMTINVDGELWVPVEVTLLGSSDFLSAWRRGIELYQQFKDDPERSGFYITADAQATYRPVGLRQADLGLQYGTESSISREFTGQLSELVETILGDFEDRARARNRARDHNSLGIAQARFGELGASQASFRTAIRLDSDYLEPRVNLGALELLRENYYGAILALQGAANQIDAAPETNPETRTAVFINLARAHYALDEFDDAQGYFAMATDIDPAKAAEYSYLASVAADGATGRASEVNNSTIPFAGEGAIPGE